MRTILLLYKILQVLLKYEPIAEQAVSVLVNFFHDLEQHKDSDPRVVIVPTPTMMRAPQTPTPFKPTDFLPSEKPPSGSTLEADLKRLHEIASEGP